MKKVFNDESDTLVTDAEITCVFIDSTTREVVPLSEEIKKSLA